MIRTMALLFTSLLTFAPLTQAGTNFFFGATTTTKTDKTLTDFSQNNILGYEIGLEFIGKAGYGLFVNYGENSHSESFTQNAINYENTIDYNHLDIGAMKHFDLTKNWGLSLKGGGFYWSNSEKSSSSQYVDQSTVWYYYGYNRTLDSNKVSRNGFGATGAITVDYSIDKNFGGVYLTGQVFSEELKPIGAIGIKLYF